MIVDFGGTLDAALADVEKIGGLGLGGFANWRMLVIAALQRRQLGRHHSALRGIQMSAPDIHRDDEGNRIVALEDREVRRDTCHLAGAVAIAAVEDFILEHYYHLTLAVRFDIGNERLELGALQ